jgi:hypothetical protein
MATCYDLYTISEIFSKYPDLALIWKQTGKLQYQLCFDVNHMAQLAISRNEFYKYFLLLDYVGVCDKMIVFYAKDDDTIFCIKHDKEIRKGQLVQSLQISFSDRGVRPYLPSFSDGTSISNPGHVGERYKTERLVEKYIQKKEYPWNKLPVSFRDPLSKVFFDVKTTYEILKRREACDQIIKNYAKEKTLEQFNNMVALFAKKNLASFHLYVRLNAGILDINLAKIVSQYPDKSIQLIVAASKVRDIINSW